MPKPEKAPTKTSSSHTAKGSACRAKKYKEEGQRSEEGRKKKKTWEINVEKKWEKRPEITTETSSECVCVCVCVGGGRIK